MLTLLPESHATVFRRKVAYNLREAIEIHRKETDKERILKLIEDYQHNIALMKDIFSLDPQTLKNLIPLFDIPVKQGAGVVEKDHPEQEQESVSESSS